MLDLDAIVIDGALPRGVLDDLTVRVRRALATIDLTGMQPPAIVAGTVGADARALGAASLPLSHRFLVDGGA